MLDEQAQSFAKTCIERGITDLNTTALREKAKLIAKQKQLDCYEDTEALQQIINDYIEAENARKDAEDRERRREICKTKKEKEQSEKKSLEKYADDVGRDKPVHYYNDRIAETQTIIDTRESAMHSGDDIRKVYRALSSSVEPVKSPPKQDWAIAGGIASALAGPAAGLAVAADIQRKNAESRVDPVEALENAAKAREVYNTAGNRLAKKILDDCGVSAEEYRAAIKKKADLIQTKEKCEVLLVDDTIDQYQLLGLLNPSVKSTQISESGSVHVSVRIKGKHYRIFEDVPAVIDGSFRALLWNKKGDCCGTAALVLPVDGAKSDMVLNAWFTQPKSQDDHYKVEFTAPNLWMVESLVEPKPENPSSLTPSKNDYSENTQIYYDAYVLSDSSDLDDIRKAIELFDSIGNWKDAPKQKQHCIDIVHEAEEKQRREAELLERKRLQREEQRRAEQEIIRLQEEKKQKIKYFLCNWVPQFVSVLVALILFILLLSNVIIPSSRYHKASKLCEKGEYNRAIEIFTELENYKDSRDMILECRYRNAVSLMEMGNAEDAIIIYNELGSYKDSAERISSYRYQQALNNIETGDYDKAIEIFESIKDYKDSAELIPYYRYQQAKNYYEAGDYDKAISIYETIRDYMDSEEQIAICTEAKNSKAYQEALALMKDKKYNSAIDAFTLIINYKDSKEQKEKCEALLKQQQYDEAIALKKKGSFAAAIDIFTRLSPYKDCEHQIEVCKFLPLTQLKVGDYTNYGAYDNKVLQWRVLCSEGDSILLITANTICDRAFQFDKYKNHPKYYIDSNIRSFLINTFYEKAFPDTHKKYIATRELSCPGGDINDKVFLLSEQEANKYFSSDEDRISTDKKQWFLRTVNPVYNQILDKSSPIAMYVDTKGKITQYDRTMNYARGVRPAMWLDISSLVKEMQ